jgi:glycosyltransferase involved in cell wall biosynthesis
MNVAVCIATFRRPQGLDDLLKGLAALKLADDGLDVKVVVVENDSDGPGREVCDRWRERFPFPLIYGAEPRRGIPFARNTSVALAGDVDFLAFIDDDEIPEPEWLAELLKAQARCDADLVSGPVLARYEQPPPAWMAEGRFHDNHFYKTGDRVMPTGAGNVLIRKTAIDQIVPPFDESLALAGGSDGQLFFNLKRLGCSAVYTEAAVAHELVPPSRCTWRWMLGRDYRIGISHGAHYRQEHPRFAGLLGCGYQGLKKIAFAITHYPKAVFTGKVNRAIHIKSMARGAGFIAGGLGFRYQEYRKIHGK